jgi:hypothetical protein
MVKFLSDEKCDLKHCLAESTLVFHIQNHFNRYEYTILCGRLKKYIFFLPRAHVSVHVSLWEDVFLHTCICLSECILCLSLFMSFCTWPPLCVTTVFLFACLAVYLHVRRQWALCVPACLSCCMCFCVCYAILYVSPYVCLHMPVHLSVCTYVCLCHTAHLLVSLSVAVRLFWVCHCVCLSLHVPVCDCVSALSYFYVGMPVSLCMWTLSVCVPLWASMPGYVNVFLPFVTVSVLMTVSVFFCLYLSPSLCLAECHSGSLLSICLWAYVLLAPFFVYVCLSVLLCVIICL